jgi:Zn-dependent protease
MAYGGYGGGSSGARRPRRRFQPDQRTIIIVVVAVAIVAILLRTNKISRFEVIYFLVLVPSIILHEISHGVVALFFGDDTAKRAGRLTLNPLKHVDPVGTLLVPAVLSLSGLGAYGWAKPVPVSTNRLRSPRNHTVVVSLVGPLTNFVLAAILGVILVATSQPGVLQAVHFYWSAGGEAYPPSLVGQVLFIAGIANIVLGVFNLIPCPPLDGASVLERFLPARMLPEYYRLQPFLMFLPFILILFFRNEWGQLIDHVITWWSGLLV